MSAPAQTNVDIDALLDLSAYDNGYNSPSLSPSSSSKPTFASPISAVVTTPSVPSSTPQTLSGPSHDYELYRQQTGFVPGAIANTMAVNQTHNTGYQDVGSLEYISHLTPENDMFDFNTSPAHSSMEIDFGSPAESHQLFNTVNPSNIEQDPSTLRSPTAPSTSGSVGRLWPGAHSQAALAKAQAQQRQQHTMQQQQTQRSAQQQRSRGKAPQPTDPLVEQKITQLLNSMRAKSSAHDAQGQAAVSNLPRARKDEEDMDEDERLLASEEGKKLSSKERRQLRNKVSARAFRSRRKEYITQLESEIATKVNENGDLRARNRALEEENRQLSELTRMLLGSPSFSTLLENLSTNPAAPTQAPQVKIEPQQQAQDMSHLRKDVNPHSSQHLQQQQIGMAMVPEQSMDFSMLSLDNAAAYNFQPQVFIVDTPEMPAALDASILSGKARDFVEETVVSNEDSKVEVPVIERPAESTEVSESVDELPVDEEFERDPEFALFHSEPASAPGEQKTLDTGSLDSTVIFGGIETDKMLSRYELVDGSKDNMSAALAMARVQRISATMESVVSRLELLTMDL